jgi:hypothetical protein
MPFLPFSKPYFAFREADLKIFRVNILKRTHTEATKLRQRVDANSITRTHLFATADALVLITQAIRAEEDAPQRARRDIQWKCVSGMKTGRSDRIRTYDPLVPNEVRYQAALHSVRPVEAVLQSARPSCNPF